MNSTIQHIKSFQYTNRTSQIILTGTLFRVCSTFCHTENYRKTMHWTVNNILKECGKWLPGKRIKNKKQFQGECLISMNWGNISVSALKQ